MDDVPRLPVSLEKWLQRIEDKQNKLDNNISDGLQQIRSQLDALEKSLPDRFLTRREWDVVLEAGRINREAQEALMLANNERHTAQYTDIDSRIRELEGHGWWIAGSFTIAFMSIVGSTLLHFLK